MKTLTLDDKLYTALEEEAIKVGRPVGELLTEAVEQWLLDAELDEAELREIESADQEWRQNSGLRVAGGGTEGQLEK